MNLQSYNHKSYEAYETFGFIRLFFLLFSELSTSAVVLMLYWIVLNHLKMSTKYDLKAYLTNHDGDVW